MRRTSPPRVCRRTRNTGEQSRCLHRWMCIQLGSNKQRDCTRWAGRKGTAVHLTRALGGQHWSQWKSWLCIYHLAILLVSPKVYVGSQGAHCIHEFSVTHFNTLLSRRKSKNFVPFPFQIPRNLMVFHEISKIIARPALLPFSAFVLCSDFPVLDTRKHTASQHCLSSSTIITWSIPSAITLCHQAWLMRQDKPSFSFLSFPICSLSLLRSQSTFSLCHLSLSCMLSKCYFSLLWLFSCYQQHLLYGPAFTNFVLPCPVPIPATVNSHKHLSRGPLSIFMSFHFITPLSHVSIRNYYSIMSLKSISLSGVIFLPPCPRPLVLTI